jgi:hypothetical protein
MVPKHLIQASITGNDFFFKFVEKFFFLSFPKIKVGGPVNQEIKKVARVK